MCCGHRESRETQQRKHKTRKTIRHMTPVHAPTIRRARMADIDRITTHNLAMALETEDRTLDPDTVRKGVAAVIDHPERGFYLLAEKDREVVGQCMVTREWSDWRCGDFWWIQSVYVREEYRGSGVFTHLFRALETEARSQEDVVGLRLYVEESNRGAQRTYERLGMQATRYLLFEREFD